MSRRPWDSGEMSFEEIARKLRISRAGAAYIYHRALRKIRRNPSRWREFAALVAMRRRIKEGVTAE